MPQLLKSPQAAQWGSALLVVLASAVVGHEAAQGMDPQQWACAAFAVLGSVSVAVMVRVWPAPSKQAIEE
jgi:hypothetical protein